MPPSPPPLLVLTMDQLGKCPCVSERVGPISGRDLNTHVVTLEEYRTWLSKYLLVILADTT